MVGDSEETERTPVDHSPVDQAGVRRVAEFEREAGRHPELMAHENPGFDVISRDNAGRILRHIEVKSTARRLGRHGGRPDPDDSSNSRSSTTRRSGYMLLNMRSTTTARASYASPTLSAARMSSDSTADGQQ